MSKSIAKALAFGINILTVVGGFALQIAAPDASKFFIGLVFVIGVVILVTRIGKADGGIVGVVFASACYGALAGTLAATGLGSLSDNPSTLVTATAIVVGLGTVVTVVIATVTATAAINTHYARKGE